MIFPALFPFAEPVDNSYFDDAVFIGDSRTEGLITNTGLSNTTAYTYKGLMVDTVFTKPVIRRGENRVSVMDALKTTSFSKDLHYVWGSMRTAGPTMMFSFINMRKLSTLSGK